MDTDRFDGTLADLHAFAGTAPPKPQKTPSKPRPTRPRREPKPLAKPAPLAAVDVFESILAGALGRRAKR